jgi:hypothetical protein
MVVATPAAPRPIVLDPVSSTVWPLLLSGATIGEVCESLATDRDEAAAIERFVTALVEQLLEAGFLRIAGEDTSGRARRFHATCSPCDTAALLKGPTTTLELEIGGVGVTVLVLDRTEVAPRMNAVSAPREIDPLDLFVIGRVPRRGTPALFDHHGVELLESDWEHVGDLADLLVDDLRRLRGAELTLRGVAVSSGDGVVLVHERWRTLSRRAAAAGLVAAPSPSALFPVELGDDGPVVEVRSAEAPHRVESVPLRAVGLPEEPTDGAATLAGAAALLRDPCDLAAARRLSEHVELVALPTDGMVGTFAEWVERAGARRSPG